MQLPPPILHDPSKPPRNGWLRTWSGDSETDGVYWRHGYKMGRAWQYWDGRWFWVSWCRHGGHGLVATKEDAKRMVEEKADLTNMSITCIPGAHHTVRKQRFDQARQWWPEASKSAAK